MSESLAVAENPDYRREEPKGKWISPKAGPSKQPIMRKRLPRRIAVASMRHLVRVNRAVATNDKRRRCSKP
jgi:hypothetical protein